MKLGLQFREQLILLGGETLATEFETLMSGVQAGWAVEHQVDDTHGDIHALTIRERGRTLPLGEWTPVNFTAADYTGSGTLVWTLDPADMITFAYTLIGKMMIVSLVLNATTVAGVGAVLQVKIPGGFVAARVMRGYAEIVDNGVRVTGRIGVAANGSVIQFQRTDAANWTAAVNNTNMSGQLMFEVVI